MPLDAKSTSHLIYASTKLRSSQGRAFRESSQRVVRSGQLAYESFVTRQTVFQSSNVCDTVAGVLDLVFCFCGSCGVGRSVDPVAPESGVQFVGVVGVVTDEIPWGFRDHHLHECGLG